MINDFIYQELPGIPHPPEWLINLIDFDLIPDSNNIGNRGQRYLEDWQGFTGRATTNTLRQVDSRYTQWIADNLTTQFQDGMVNYCCGTPDRTSTGAHTDFTRDWLLLYNLRTGGANAKLCFWQEQGHSLIRDRKTEVGKYSNLKLIKEITGPSNVWYLINTRILHSTENVTELRLNLQVAFDNRFPQELLKYV
jgi:hypothetical protein